MSLHSKLDFTSKKDMLRAYSYKARTALHNRNFISKINGVVKAIFRATRDIFQCYAELKRLSLKRQEDILDYDGRNQNLYYDIIEVKRSRKKPFTDSDVSEINRLFVRSFHIRGGIIPLAI